MSLSIKALASAGLSLCAGTALATTVQFQTVMGDFEVNLYDQDTPETVANFLEYVNAGDYENTFIHRSVPGFVVQGGGFTFDPDDNTVAAISANAPVVNEPVFSNVRGTIAMAKSPTSPDSATNQWFFNLTDNSANLDNQNGGFTVFGEVTGNGMAIIDAIAQLSRADFSPADFWNSSAFEVVPVRDYTQEDMDATTLPTEDNIVLIQNIMVLDAAPDTAAGLNPPRSTATGDDSPSGGGGGGGSFGLGLLTLLALGSLGRKIINRG